MTERFTRLPTRAQVGIALGVALLYFLALWFLLIAPKRAEATSLAEDLVAAELRLTEVQAASNGPRAAASPGARVSDVLRLAKAMPSSADQPGLVLEIDRLARSTGIKLGSITPGEAVIDAGGPTAIPVVVMAEGSFRQITRFVRRARELVRFSGGKVRATGRLFTVRTVEITESKARKFPFIDATITMNAFVYDGPIVPEAPLPTPSEEDDATSGAAAAGATP